ncbi:alpha/beta fold hydrolase [Galactobacter sp.]|uniref:alpha/beta fold hydrolase n=1 Tax=Galactobacter sp. TaxID=2676125 RepID=UPI0025BA5DD0|nr:alpha/beta fold hydrolase [Galactobacter sp.]
MTFARPATPLSTSTPRAWRGVVTSGHHFEVPLVHAEPSRGSLRVFARTARADEPGAERRPWLVFLQGGPGMAALRPDGGASGWLATLLPHFQVVLLDQRGTGLSSPIDARSIAAVGNLDAQVEYLSHFRAPDIVADAEAVRQGLGIESWSTLGQSYGGFITLSYLSFAPEHLDRSLITAGLGSMSGDATDVYRATYRRIGEREDEFFAWHPEDEERLAEVYDVVRSRRAAGAPERLADGGEVTETTVAHLGMMLGGNTRVQGLHHALEEAVVTIAGERRLSAAFLSTLAAQFDHLASPLYWLLQESIYSEGAATDWAADRVRREDFPQYVPDAERPRLLGEHAVPQDFDEVPSLRPVRDLAHALHATTQWGPLYDREQLARNCVPVAAAVYTPDIYVDRELSLTTAAQVSGLQVWESPDYHHDGIRDDPDTILPQLFTRTGVAGA